MGNVIVQSVPALSKRLLIAIPLLLVFLAVYFVVYSKELKYQPGAERIHTMKI